jgi:hypothetical protein
MSVERGSERAEMGNVGLSAGKSNTDHLQLQSSMKWGMATKKKGERESTPETGSAQLSRSSTLGSVIQPALALSFSRHK